MTESVNVQLNLTNYEIRLIINALKLTLESGEAMPEDIEKTRYLLEVFTLYTTPPTIIGRVGN